MKRIREHLVFALALAMLPIGGGIAEERPNLQSVSMSYQDTTQSNNSIVRRWTITTANEAVDNEINGIVDAFREDLEGTLQEASNKTTKSSWLDLDVRYSQTGDAWLSFLATARVSYHRDILKTRLASRTYNMATGETVTLSDIFAPDSLGWYYLKSEAVRQICDYFPNTEPDPAALYSVTQNITSAAFTLHAMSLVLHFPAEMFYQDRHTLIEVTIMYPEIRGMMTQEAQRQTDNSNKKMIALTYDDGPMRTPTTKLLNKLREYGVRATFFLIGTRIEGEKDLVQREHDEGHAIGAHNWTHADVTHVSEGTIRGYRDKFDAALINAIGIPSRYDRVPYGLYPQMVKAKAGWPYIQWSVDTYDWRGRSASTILSKIKKEAADGDIVLFHDIKPLSSDIADKIIPYLQEQGFMFVTIDELFARDGVVLENENVYYRCVDGDTSRK